MGRYIIIILGFLILWKEISIVSAQFGTNCTNMYDRKCFQRECGTQPNQMFDPCGSYCQTTCDNLYKNRCSLECVPGCVCKPGYVRGDTEWNCIPQYLCSVYHLYTPIYDSSKKK